MGEVAMEEFEKGLLSEIKPDGVVGLADDESKRDLVALEIQDQSFLVALPGEVFDQLHGEVAQLLLLFF